MSLPLFFLGLLSNFFPFLYQKSHVELIWSTTGIGFEVLRFHRQKKRGFELASVDFYVLLFV